MDEAHARAQEAENAVAFDDDLAQVCAPAILWYIFLSTDLDLVQLENGAQAGRLEAAAVEVCSYLSGSIECFLYCILDCTS